MTSTYLILLISVIGPILGSLIGVLKKPSQKMMSIMLSFAAGVMLTISFLELIPASIEDSSILYCMIGVTIGALVMYILDKIIPHIHPELCSQEQGKNLKRTSFYLMCGIALHNLPEGLAIGMASLKDASVTLAIAIAIAVHNIPEGICTASPLYYCSKNKLKSFLISSSTAIPLIVGFLIVHLFFQNIPTYVLGVITAATAGLMIYISGDELIPVSCTKKDHSSIFALILGVLFVISISNI